MSLRLGILKPLVLAISLATLNITGCSQQESNNSKAETQQLLSRANSYFGQGQFRAAVIEANNALQKDKGNLAANTLIAQVYNELGDAKQAISVLEKIDYKSNNDAYLAYVKANVTRGKANTALELIKAAPSTLTDKQKLKLKIETARAYLISGNPQEAEKVFEEIASSSDLESKNEARTGLAAISYQAQDKEKALSLLDEVLSSDANYTDALVMKASIAFKDKDLDKTEDLLSQALLNIPNTDILTAKRVQVLDGLVNVLTRQGRTAEAMVYTKILSDARPGADAAKAQFDEAMALFREGKLKEAEEKLLQFYNENNAPDAAGRVLGLIKMQEGDLEGAEEYFQQHIDPETANADTLRVVAENKLRMNNPAEALKLIEENINKSPSDPSLLAIYGLAALSHGEEQKGIQAIEKALALAPDRSRLRLALADYYTKKGNSLAAMAQLKEAVAKTPEDFAIRARLIKQLLINKQPDQAKAEAEQIAGKFTANPEALAIAASTFLQLKMPAQAKATYDKALSIDPKHINSLVGKSLLQIQAQQWQEAIDTTNSILAIDPDNLRAYKVLVVASAKANKLDGLAEALKTLSKDNINAWGPDATLAEYYLSKGDPETALIHAKESLARSGFKGYPKRLASNVYMQLARIATQKKDYAEARTKLVEALQSDTNSLPLLDLLAHVEISAEKYREVDKIAKQIRDAYPDSPTPDIIESDKLFKQQKTEESKAILKALWKKTPTDAIAGRLLVLLKGDEAKAFAQEWSGKLQSSAEAQVSYAMLQQSNGDVDAAIATYKKALQLSPNDPRALNNLAWIFYENNKFDDALKLSTQAVLVAPNDPAILDTHGWILFNTGKNEEAKSILLKAAQLAPGSAEIQDHYKKALN